MLHQTKGSLNKLLLETVYQYRPTGKRIVEWSLSVVFSELFTVLQFMVFRALDSEVLSLFIVLNIWFCPLICPVSFKGMVKKFITYLRNISFCLLGTCLFLIP